MRTITKIEKKEAYQNKEFYSIRRILGHSWAIFFLLLGGRQAGKSYSCMDFFLRQYRTYGRPFYWLRLTDASQRELLINNGEKLIDADLRRKYDIEVKVVGDSVYEVVKRGKAKDGGKGRIIEKRFMGRVMALSTFYNDKGSGLFDKDFLLDPKMFYNIAFDEMNREQSERRTFDILYAFTNQLENLVRNTKQRLRVICIGNTLEEASDLLCAFNFIPEKWGVFKLKKKRCVIENIEPTKAYKNMRAGSIADILMPNASTFTNKVDTDTALVTKKRLIKPSYVIKFSTDKDRWFTLWDGDVIKKWNGEKNSPIAMRPYIHEIYNAKIVANILETFDSRGYKFHDLITFKTFQKELELLKPRK